MQIFEDSFMMTIDMRYEVSVSEAGIISLSSAWVNDQTAERFEHKRIYGTIVAPPVGFSNKVLELMDPGYPTPKAYISGEYIEAKLKSGNRKYGKEYYSCAGFDEFEKVTMADWAANTDIRMFDKVYFDPRVTEPENLLGYHERKEMYKIQVDEIICSVRDGKIITQGEWCLVEADMETWQEIRTERGIYKKPAPEAKQLRGIMRHFKEREGLEEGDTIVFVHGSDWNMKVEGKTYYAIQNSDIICKLQS